MTAAGGDRRYPGVTPRGLGPGGTASDILQEVELLLGTPLQDEQRERLWRIQAMVRTLMNAREPLVPAPPQRRLRILLIEDNPFNQELMSRLLTVRGHTVQLAEGEAAALANLRDGNPEVVLLDLGMPELEGLATCRAIRRQEELTGRRVPIIAITALTSPQEQERARQAGVDGFHGKPIQADQLLQEIDRVLHHRDGAEPPPAPPREEEAPPLVDLDRVLKSVDGDWSLLEEVSNLFFSEAPRQLDTLGEQIRAGNADQVREVAHSLKGSSGAFGKGPAFQLAFRLEQMARSGDLTHAEATWRELKGTIGRMESTLKKILSEGGI